MTRIGTTVAALVLAAVVSLPGYSRAGDPAGAESLQTLVETALANNPELTSSDARWRMYMGKIRQASSWDDPMLMLKMQNVPLRTPLAFNRDTMTARVIGLSQQIPFWGKLDLKEEIARSEADAYRWQIQERRLDLARMVKELYYQIYAVDRALETVAKSLAIVVDLQKIAETRYAVGQGAQADIIRAGVEQSKLLEMQISLQQRRTSLVANLNYLLARPSGSAVTPSGAFELPPVVQGSEELKALALNNNPRFKELTSLARKGAAAEQLAARESYPDFNVSAEYMQREPAMGSAGDDMYSLALTVNLPLRKERREAMRAESSAESTMAAEEIRAFRNEVGFTVSDTIALMERRRKLVELYRTGLIPQAEQSLESSLIGYRTGKVEFTAVLDGRATLYNYERDLYESKAEYMMALARLEAAVGGVLGAKGDR